MKMTFHLGTAMAGLIGIISGLPGNLAAQPRPLPHPVVPPQAFQEAVAAGTRSGSGAPGESYWQQWTDYRLTVRLDPEERELLGLAELVYYNNSPDTLDVLYLHLYQNLHALGSLRLEFQEVTGGVRMERVTAAGRELRFPEVIGRPGYYVEGTLLTLTPHVPLAPGDSIRMSFDWSFRIPQQSSGRMGWSKDNLFYIAYWYPQMAVYDDVVGWHLDQYLGNAEFYSGFGNYRLSIEAPEDWLVMATGRLLNGPEVLSQTVLERIARAEQSDEVVQVITEEDLSRKRVTRRGMGTRLRWDFAADSVRDVAFSVTRESVWDAVRAPVGDLNDDGVTDYTRIDAIYRPSAERWQQQAQYGRHSIDFLSRFTGLSYPWPHMTSVEGGGIITGGMEFPMMTLIGDYQTRGDSALYYVTAHEFAHMWVPMIVSNDERRYAWMDEGTTSFNENQARKEFFPGFDHDDPDRQDYMELAGTDSEGEILRWSDFHYSDEAYRVASYRKPATALVALRRVLGDEVFLEGFRTFLERWAFKHPKPWDLFNSFERASGRDLDWFWSAWYSETWVLDQAVSDVRQDAGGVTVVVEDLGLMPMPVFLDLTLADGSKRSERIPVHRWLDGSTRVQGEFEVDQLVVRVEIDPRGTLPDVDRVNNVWTAPDRD